VKTYRYLNTDKKRFMYAIQKWLANADKTDDKELAKQYHRDAKDLLAVMARIEWGNMHSALQLINQLDTPVRDQIPKRLYNFIAKANGYL
jgi:capsule polysaccharide export protein KpsE/RkpR